jgi:hypothetical protein
MARPEMPFGQIDWEYAGRLATTPSEQDGPIWMVNFMRYKQRADYGDGGDQGITGREADERYAPVEVLKKVGADVAYFGDVVDAEGGSAPEWDRIAIVRYPTRRSFIDMQARSDFQEKYVHKEAGMAFTIIVAALPLGPVQGEPDDSGIVSFTVFPPGSGRTGLTAEGAFFSIEGTPIGDDRRWERLEVWWSDRTVDVPDGAMTVRSVPLIDRLRDLIDSPNPA